MFLFGTKREGRGGVAAILVWQTHPIKSAVVSECVDLAESESGSVDIPRMKKREREKCRDHPGKKARGRLGGRLLGGKGAG